MGECAKYLEIAGMLHIEGTRNSEATRKVEGGVQHDPCLWRLSENSQLCIGEEVLAFIDDGS
jgi:hypothetical protein